MNCETVDSSVDLRHHTLLRWFQKWFFGLAGHGGIAPTTTGKNEHDGTTDQHHESTKASQPMSATHYGSIYSIASLKRSQCALFRGLEHLGE